MRSIEHSISLTRVVFVTTVGIGLIAGTAAFVFWWNYATLEWSYPRYKVQARQWWWRTFGDPFEVESRELTGHNPKDCSPGSSSETGISECIADAGLQKRGFQLRAEFCGIDSCGVTGVIGRPDGTAYEAGFDVYKEFVSVWRRPCPIPLKIGTTESSFGYAINCLPEATSESEYEIVRDDFAEQRGKRSQ